MKLSSLWLYQQPNFPEYHHVQEPTHTKQQQQQQQQTVKQFPSGLHQIYATYLEFVLAENGLSLIFVLPVKRIVNLRK